MTTDHYNSENFKKTNKMYVRNFPINSKTGRSILSFACIRSYMYSACSRYTVVNSYCACVPHRRHTDRNFHCACVPHRRYTVCSFHVDRNGAYASVIRIFRRYSWRYSGAYTRTLRGTNAGLSTSTAPEVWHQCVCTGIVNACASTAAGGI